MYFEHITGLIAFMKNVSTASLATWGTKGSANPFARINPIRESTKDVLKSRSTKNIGSTYAIDLIMLILDVQFSSIQEYEVWKVIGKFPKARSEKVIKNKHAMNLFSSTDISSILVMANAAFTFRNGLLKRNGELRVDVMLPNEVWHSPFCNIFFTKCCGDDVSVND